MTGSQRDTLNPKIKLQDRALIDRAASRLGKSPTDFALEAARQAAANVLLDRTVFVLKPRAFARFLARVDGPSKPNNRLRRSLQTSAPLGLKAPDSPHQEIATHLDSFGYD